MGIQIKSRGILELKTMKPARRFDNNEINELNRRKTRTDIEYVY